MLTKAQLSFVLLFVDVVQTHRALVKQIKINKKMKNIIKAQDDQITFLISLLERNEVPVDIFEQIAINELFNHPDL